jgi:hypothetical protein
MNATPAWLSELAYYHKLLSPHEQRMLRAATGPWYTCRVATKEHVRFRSSGRDDEFGDDPPDQDLTTVEEGICFSREEAERRMDSDVTELDSLPMDHVHTIFEEFRRLGGAISHSTRAWSEVLFPRWFIVRYPDAPHPRDCREPSLHFSRCSAGLAALKLRGAVVLDFDESNTYHKTLLLITLGRIVRAIRVLNEMERLAKERNTLVAGIENSF